MKKIFIIFLFFVLKPNTYCQHTDGQIIDINNIVLPVKNNGNIGTLTLDGETHFGTYQGIRFLFGGGFYLSGYDNDSLWSNEILWGSDYEPGNVGSNSNNPLYRFYNIKSTDPDFGQSWQDWKNAVDQCAKFYDGNNDGIYTPVDLNENGIWDADEDRPDLLGDFTTFCVHRDDMRLKENESPVGIEVRQTIFGTGSDEIEELRDVLFIRYEILNTGSVNEVLDSVLFGIAADADIGQNYWDDLTGCDTSFNRAYTYNLGSDPNYGDTLDVLPAFMIDMLQGPHAYIPGETFIDNNANGIYDSGIDTPLASAISNNGEFLGQELKPGAKNLKPKWFFPFNSGTRPPDTKEQIRKYLKCIQKREGEVDPCTWQYGNGADLPNCREINNDFVHSGNPVTGEGWLNTLEVESRMILSTGPFELKKDEPVEILIAYVVGLGETNTNSITVARQIDDIATAVYENNFTNLPVHVEQSRESIPLQFSIEQNYPNPFNPTTSITYQLPQNAHVKLVVYNSLGQVVRTLVDENKSAGRYSITFNASNLPSGVYFYRIQAGDYVSVKKMLLMK